MARNLGARKNKKNTKIRNRSDNCRGLQNPHRVETTTRGLFSSIQVGLLLGFSNIFLVTNSFVTEPIGNLNYAFKKELVPLFHFKRENGVLINQPVKRWSRIYEPTLLWLPHLDRGCLGASKNTRSKFQRPACWSCVASSYTWSEIEEKTPLKRGYDQMTGTNFTWRRGNGIAKSWRPRKCFASAAFESNWTCGEWFEPSVQSPWA